MFLHRCARPLGILVEEQQALRQLTVVQTIGLQHVGSHSLVVAIGDERLDALAFVLLAGSIERIVESELLDGVKVLLLEIGSWYIVVGIHKSEHILKHTAGSTRCRHKLHHALALSLVGVPDVLILLALSSIGGNDSTTDTSGSLELQEGETSLKFIQLILNLLLGNTLLSNLF